MPGEVPPPAPRGLRSLPLLLLLLLSARAALAQRWRNENYERPVDLEGSGDDDPFGEDELDDVYSGSGSGYFEPELGLDTAVSLTTDTLVTLPTTAAVLPVTAAQPVATPLEPSPSPQDTTPGQATSAFLIPRTTAAPLVPSWKGTTTPSTAAREPPTTTATTAVTTTVATTTPTTVATTTTTTTTTEATTTTSSTTVATAKPTTIRRFLPPLATKAATTRATTLETPTTPVLEASTPTEVATSLLVPSSTAKPRALPKPSTSRTAEPPEKSTALPTATTLPPTEAPQMEPGEVTTVPDSELEVPASSGPSGDFEIREEEETTRPELGNEVMAVVTAPAAPGSGRNVETGLMDNTIDSGNSAAQLPQKNILERKEVLIAVIVGGVVGALFAAFLVMLLIYRMKKKDEGSYTLEEPKQANVTYQKPDKQEEFYA
ncbi:PREDICTED: syndecan-3 [Sturnus vulgaris]|uniref:syndecan-3 n=1 Tax=Sturnus vulgaris TaxID=9172 RepID=UPI000719F6C0|nr:PREDICTED: syndecan-3 [Sturnus vulgaris]